MYVQKMYVNRNMATCNGVLTYHYKVPLINSIYTAKTQKTTLLETMFDLIQGVNMPGYIMIAPSKIQNNNIYKFYLDSYKKYGRKEHMKLAQSMLKDIKEINDKKENYKYHLYLCFCDGRADLKKKSPLNKIMGSKNAPFDKSMMELFDVCEREIYKKLEGLSLNASRLDKPEEIQSLYQYIAIPLEKKIVDYYTEPTPDKIVYHYERLGNATLNTLYSKTMVVSKFDRLEVVNDEQVDDVMNCLQLNSFPTDIFIKFDMEHTKEFKRNMQSKKVEVEKKLDTYYNSSNSVDQVGKKAKALAEIGETRDEGQEKSKMRWQVFFRIRSNDENRLDRYNNDLRKMLEGKSISLSNEFGEQERLANNLFPWASDYVKYVQLTDIKYFVRFNWLGGLSIGEDNEGFIETYTKPGGIPVLTNISNTLTETKSKSNSTTSIYVGGTGAGKTQQADLRAFTYMVFKGMRVLCIDPKGDRDKKVEMLGDNASHLKIGSAQCQNGMFDSYLLYKNPKDSLSQAKKDIDSLSAALKVGHSFSYKDITDAHEDMLDAFSEKRVKRLSFTCLVKNYLIKYDKKLANELLTLRDDDMGRLFFADENTTYDEAFNLNKPYNLVTFAKIPQSISKGEGEFDPNRLEMAIFAVILSRCQNIITGFSKRYKDEEKLIEFDEYKVYKSIPGGRDLVINTNRTVRSDFTHLLIIAQNFTDIDDDILNNTGQYFIGSLGSPKEIDYVLEYLSLTSNSAVRDVLRDRTKDEGVNVQKKYNFLFVDYNGRKCITRNIIPKTFVDVFRTLKKEEDISLNSIKVETLQDERELHDSINDFISNEEVLDS